MGCRCRSRRGASPQVTLETSRFRTRRMTGVPALVATSRTDHDAASRAGKGPARRAVERFGNGRGVSLAPRQMKERGPCRRACRALREREKDSRARPFGRKGAAQGGGAPARNGPEGAHGESRHPHGGNRAAPRTSVIPSKIFRQESPSLTRAEYWPQSSRRRHRARRQARAAHRVISTSTVARMDAPGT